MWRPNGLVAALTVALPLMLAACGRSSLYDLDAGCPAGAGGHCIEPPDLSGRPRDMGRDMRSTDMRGDMNNGCGTSIPCSDPICINDPACVPPGREICNNGLDDNDDGLVDCADPECFGNPFCAPRDGGTDMQTCFDPSGNPICDRPECTTLPECLHLSCDPEIHFGTVTTRDYDQTRIFDTRGAIAEYKTCAFPGGTARVGEFTLTATADVRLDFAQPTGSAHVVTLNRAGFDQLCDDNEFFCLQANQSPMQTHTFAQLAPGTYYIIVQSFPGTQGATTVRLSTGRSSMPEICDNGIDDDGNGLVDCADQACATAPNCVDVTCKPEKNLGALVVGDPPKTVDVDTRNTSNRFFPTCAGSSTGNDYVVRFTLHETAGVLVDWSQAAGGDHVISIFNTPPPGVACDGAGQTSCYWTMAGNGGSIAFSPRPPGDYIFIIKAHDRQSMGTMRLNVSAYANRQQEICSNGIDDDGNGLIDCLDPACFGVGNCKPPICVPDVDLGDFDWSTVKSTTVDTRGGVDYYSARCAQGGGKSRVVRVTLTQPMGLGFDCDETGSHVLQLTQRVQPLDPCDANPVNCADPTVLPFGCNFVMPGLQPGTYELLVQAFSPGQEGIVNLTLFGVQERAQELCDNGVDDNGDGKVDCADPSCFTSPLCQRFTCHPDKSLGLLPLDGSVKSTTVQSADNGDKFKTSCASQIGGQDAVIDFSLPARSNLTIEWAQGGNHTFALYPNVNDSAACNAGTAVSCTPSNGQLTGSFTLNNVAGGKYHLIVDADRPGAEGGAVLQVSARPAL